MSNEILAVLIGSAIAVVVQVTTTVVASCSDRKTLLRAIATHADGTTWATSSIRSNVKETKEAAAEMLDTMLPRDGFAGAFPSREQFGFLYAGWTVRTAQFDQIQAARLLPDGASSQVLLYVDVLERMHRVSTIYRETLGRVMELADAQAIPGTLAIELMSRVVECHDKMLELADEVDEVASEIIAVAEKRSGYRKMADGKRLPRKRFSQLVHPFRRFGRNSNPHP